MATDLEIAIRRLETLIALSREALVTCNFMNEGVSASEAKNRYKEALQELQDNISQLENKLSENPQTVEETQL